MIIWRMFCRPIHFSELVIHFFHISIQNFFLAFRFSFLDETIEITGVAAVDFVEVSFRKCSKVGPVDLVQVTLLSAKAHSSAWKQALKSRYLVFIKMEMNILTLESRDVSLCQKRRHLGSPTLDLSSWSSEVYLHDSYISVIGKKSIIRERAAFHA